MRTFYDSAVQLKGFTQFWNRHWASWCLVARMTINVNRGCE